MFGMNTGMGPLRPAQVRAKYSAGMVDCFWEQFRIAHYTESTCAVDI